MLQHFVEDSILSHFHSQTQPQLYYMGKILPEISAYPRILHSHAEHVEISVIYSGTSEYFIGDRRQVIRPGDILVYNAGVVHDELSSAQTQIGSYFFAVGNISLPHLPPNALIPDDVNPVFHIKQDFSAIQTLCEAMLAHFEQTSVWSPRIIYYETMALLEIVWQVIHEQQQQQMPPQYPIGQKILAYMNAHYREPITMSQLSEALHLSESYISHVFREMIGCPPMQYVLRKRIGEAQTLLISTDYPISRIAQMVGFDSQSHFNKRFRAYVGISPGQFRKNYKT